MILTKIKFNKQQQTILKKAFNHKEFTIKLYNMVMDMDIIDLNKKLNKIGYRLNIKLGEK